MMQGPLEFYRDDGTPVNPDLIPKPGLCLTCKHDEDRKQQIPCTLNRRISRAKMILFVRYTKKDNGKCFFWENIWWSVPQTQA